MTSTNPISPKSEFGQWHQIAFFSEKMIPAETWYQTHNGELFAIIKAFKTCKYNLESCKYKVFILINHNNLHQVINIKSLNSVRSDGLKSSFNITSELIIAIKRQIEFQTLYLAFFRDLLKKKPYYKLKMSKFFIVCNFG